MRDPSRKLPVALSIIGNITRSSAASSSTHRESQHAATKSAHDSYLVSASSSPANPAGSSTLRRSATTSSRESFAYTAFGAAVRSSSRHSATVPSRTISSESGVTHVPNCRFEKYCPFAR